MVQDGKFRQDLYYRIKVIPVRLPPLRERPEDIPLLAETFFQRIQLKSGKDTIQGISPEAMEMLQNYHWPGNIRELRSALEFAFVSCAEALIQPVHIQPSLDRMRSAEHHQQSGESFQGRDQKQELVHALRRSRGNQTQAARILGISRVTVWNRIKRYGMDVKSFKKG
jgi:DNA-binding NtrC family response regulator